MSGLSNMIEYLVAQSPDDRVLEKAFQILLKGGLVALPTDTNWVLVCDPFSKKGMESLYKIKEAPKSKHFSVLCSNISMATEIACISDPMFRVLKKIVPGHYTCIFKAKKKIIKSIKASKSDHQVGVRIPPDKFARLFLEKYGQILLSTNITHELLGLEDTSIDIYSFLIEDSLGSFVDLILDPGEYEFVGESTILDMTESDQITLVREGAGDISSLGLE